MSYPQANLVFFWFAGVSSTDNTLGPPAPIYHLRVPPHHTLYSTATPQVSWGKEITNATMSLFLPLVQFSFEVMASTLKYYHGVLNASIL